jgi:hypothetical protein
MDAPVPPTPGPALRGTGKPRLVIPPAESLSQSSSSSEENKVLIVIDARLLILISSRQGPAPRPAPCDGPRPHLKRKAVLLEVAEVATSLGKGQSGASCENSTFLTANGVIVTGCPSSRDQLAHTVKLNMTPSCSSPKLDPRSPPLVRTS